LEEHVIAYLCSLTQNQASVERLVLISTNERTRRTTEELDTVVAQERQLNDRLRKASEAYEGGVYSLEEFGERKRAIEKEKRSLAGRRRDLEAERETAKEQELAVHSLSKLLEEFPDRFREHTLRAQKAMLRQFVERIIVRDSDISVRFRHQFQLDPNT